MSTASNGDTVHVHYTGTLEDGTVFDSSQGRDPISFTLGSGTVIPGFEKAIEGLAVGEKTDTSIAPEDAYGPHREELVMQVKREQLPEGMSPDIGDQLGMQTPDGQQVPVVVVETAEETISVDANHPLAGKTLTFQLELVKIG
jgi:peptidylprolyl isomerase